MLCLVVTLLSFTKQMISETLSKFHRNYLGFFKDYRRNSIYLMCVIFFFSFPLLFQIIFSRGNFYIHCLYCFREGHFLRIYTRRMFSGAHIFEAPSKFGKQSNYYKASIMGQTYLRLFVKGSMVCVARVE